MTELCTQQLTLFQTNDNRNLTTTSYSLTARTTGVVRGPIGGLGCGEARRVRGGWVRVGWVWVGWGAWGARGGAGAVVMEG